MNKVISLKEKFVVQNMFLSQTGEVYEKNMLDLIIILKEEDRL